MESAISIGLEAAHGIAIFISNMKDTPNFIGDIKDEVNPLRNILEVLNERSQTYVLNTTQIDMLLTNQRICNQTLRSIKDILDDYARGSTSRVAFFRCAMFQLGPKADLETLMEKLTASVERLKMLSDEILTLAVPIPFSKTGSQQRPVANLYQHVQMAVMAREEGEK